MTPVKEARYARAVWGCKPGRDPRCLYLLPGDADHLRRVHAVHRIAPESLPRVGADFILQRSPLCRYIIKELDFLLKPEGAFEVRLFNCRSHSSYARSTDQVRYEFSVSTDGRYTLEQVSDEGKTIILRYRKKRASLPKGDSIDRWSFGIITGGKNTDWVLELAESIAAQKIPDYEILICGPFPESRKREHMVLLEDVSLGADKRVPICHKKNKIIRAAQFNNLCIMHDRFRLPDGWHARFREYGNYFDFLCLPTLDNDGRRFRVDWMRFCNPPSKPCVFNPAVPYASWAENQIIQGGIILGKRHWMLRRLIDERLHWQELEDMQFSQELYQLGALFNIDPGNHVVSMAVNHRAPRGAEAYLALRERLSWALGVAADFLKFHIAARSHVPK